MKKKRNSRKRWELKIRKADQRIEMILGRRRMKMRILGIGLLILVIAVIFLATIAFIS